MVKDNITLLSKNESADVEVSPEEQAQVSTTFHRTDQCHGPLINILVVYQFLSDVRTQPTQKADETDAPMAEKEDELSADNLVCKHLYLDIVCIEQTLTFIFILFSP